MIAWRSGIRPRPICFITLRIWPNCLTSWLTAWTLVPDPLAIRSRREPLVSSGRDRDRGLVLLAQVAGELGRRRRLARALQAGHDDDRRRPRRERDAGRRAAHQGGQLLVDDLDDLLAGVELPDDVGAQAALLDRRGELLDDLEVDVGLQQREADLAHGLVDVVLGQRAAAADVGQGLLELLGEGVEHWVTSLGP